MPEQTPPTSDRLADRLSEVLEAGLGLGASMARGLARATGSTDVAPSAAAPIDDIVTYGTAAASNVVRRVAATARPSPPRDSPAGQGADRSPPASGGPTVTAGSTLRIPLLVENTSGEPTHDLPFTATSLLRDGCPDDGDCTCLPTTAVQFTPTKLAVGPKDFEKLTVRIATTAETPSGDYRAAIAGGDGWFTTTIAFTVTPTA